MARVVSVAVLAVLGLSVTSGRAAGRPLAGHVQGRDVTPVRPAPLPVCVASWYGGALAGRTMANGDPFDPDALTAAYWEVPFGTMLTVTSIATGRAVDVEVTDRGPAKCLGRCVDLSREAFSRIADLDAGLVHVTVEVPASGSGGGR